MLQPVFPLKQEARFPLREGSLQSENASKTENTLADLLIHYLQSLGVEYVFGIPGGAIEPLYNALARWEGKHQGTHAIVARHEAGAVFMADGYARATGKIGVCCATTGPGATNLITGVASAYENRVPLLVITAQTASRSFGRGAFQESSDTGINIVGMMQFCTAYNSLVSHPEQFEPKLIAALSIAYKEKRPVHLSVPLDVFRGVQGPSVTTNLTSLLHPRYVYDDDEVKTLTDTLLSSKKVVVVVGKDCQEAIASIMAVAERIDAIVVTTPDAKSLINPYYPLYRGVIGFAGHDSALAAVRDPAVDAVLLLGTSLSEWCGGPLFEKLQKNRLIVVQENHLYLSRSPAASAHIQGSIKAIFERVAAGLVQHHTGEDSRGPEVRDSDVCDTEVCDIPKKPFFQMTGYTLANDWIKALVKPQWLMHQLPISLPGDTEFLADTGNSAAWAIHYLQPGHIGMERDTTSLRGGSQFHVTIEFAAMGWAIGASVGMALACQNRPVACITGDGSCLMNGQEITVAQQYNLPVVFIILNDGHLGMVKHGQKLAGAEAIGTDLPAVDFALLATAMGIESYTIRCPADWYRLNLKSTWKRAAPILLNVHIDPQEVPPIGMRVSTLAGND